MSDETAVKWEGLPVTLPPAWKVEGGVTYAPIPGYEGYWAGEDGTLWSTRTSGSWEERRERRCHAGGRDGVYRCNLRRVSRHAKLYKEVIRAVCILRAFVGERPRATDVVGRRDGDVTNDRLENLFWKPRAERAGAGPSKLSKDDLRKLLADHAKGQDSQAELGRRYGISEAYVSLLVRRKRRVRG